jgi:hypothetical protein
MGHVNHISFATTAHAGINIGWDSGGLLNSGLRLGLAGGLCITGELCLAGELCLVGELCLKGGLHLWGATLASRDVLEVLIAPGASLLGCGKSSGGVGGITSSAAAGAAAGGGGGGLLGMVGSGFLRLEVV